MPTTAGPGITREDIRKVFDVWRIASGRSDQTQLSDKRAKLIKQALSRYDMQTVLDAVTGWRYSPHHRGENDRNTVYNEIELLLRNEGYVEKFADLTRRARSKGQELPIDTPTIETTSTRDGIGMFTRPGLWKPTTA